MIRAGTLATLVLIVGMLSGCGTMGVTPEQLVKNVKGMNDENAISKYVVNRPLSQVTETFRDRAYRCLSVKVQVTTQQGYAIHTDTMVYTPRVKVYKNHTRLTLQKKFEGAIDLSDQKPAPDGYYIMVADAYPAGPNKTRIESYLGTGEETAMKAVHHWADGSNLGCPDLTQ